MNSNVIYNEDCIVGMKNIPDKIIDLIVCDLPYGTTQNSWDEIIPFEDLWEQYHRIAKDNAPIILFGSQPFTTKMIASNIENFREELVWVKNKAGSGLRSKKRHLKTHENIIVFCKEPSYVYNPIKWFVEDKKFLTQRKTMSVYGLTNNNYGKIEKTRKKDDGSRFPISLLPYAVPFTGQKNKIYNSDVDLNIHPTQKPLELIKYLIRTYSNEGDIVLDNCMGSGTTAVACLETDRKYIGFEKDVEYFNLANERILKIRK